MFSIPALCKHFGVQAEIGNKKGYGDFPIQDGCNVYFMTIYSAVVLQCKMSVMYASLTNDKLELETFVAMIRFQTYGRTEWL